ncbi:CEI_1a_G0037220.mRNA.1.CDS.1 [Saccharomyces cerevisiae]|nr:EM14S01-3B_G0039070.mRNA.1.CDS.1 [Saccharomyces cerevisiae]CAI4696171.1 CEI_1a_G0037220.mRNA.1.CDS.1 [Saccharomyces cerevisiae]CAI7428669.1 CEI_1a_G0037220.mRNA.1.CDS.1 [Saccharomyces cerevisiae]
MKLTKEKKNDCLNRKGASPSLSLFLSLYFITFITYAIHLFSFFYSVRFILLYLHILRSFYELNILLLYGAENSRRQSPPGYYVIR